MRSPFQRCKILLWVLERSALFEDERKAEMKVFYVFYWNFIFISIQNTEKKNRDVNGILIFIWHFSLVILLMRQLQTVVSHSHTVINGSLKTKKIAWWKSTSLSSHWDKHLTPTDASASKSTSLRLFYSKWFGIHFTAEPSESYSNRNHSLLLHWWNPRRSTTCLWSGRNNGARPKRGVSHSSAAHYALPWCVFADEKVNSKGE